MCFIGNYYFICSITFVFCFSLVITCFDAQNILGCNGFIKSDFLIDFSKVEIKLLSKERNLKDRTECAPNNGYYFLPLYDSGEYILSVTSQDNWSFEPSEVRVKFDRVSDPCSKGEDINFYFKGFSISGQVDNVNGKTGSSGIIITLLVNLDSEQKQLISVNTNEEGSFKLSRVPPGFYTIKASHPRWRLNKDTATFEVRDNNYIIPPESLLLSGYDVTGIVLSNNEPISQVHFILFSSKNSKADPADFIECDIGNVEEFNVTDEVLLEMKQICSVVSDKNGIFTFPSVPSGNYIIVPFYKSLHPTKFDVHPKSYNITIDQDSVIIKNPFQVIGFSVKGRVLYSKQSQKPMSNVKVQVLDLNISAVTDINGFYVLEGMKNGVFVLKFESDDVLFMNATFKISPNLPTLQDVYPSLYKVRGRVETFTDESLQVKFQKHDTEVFYAKVEGSGFFEKYLPTGYYVVSVESLHEYLESAWFSSLNQTFSVEDAPVSDIIFVQLKADLVGRVNCGVDISNMVTISIRDVWNSKIIAHTTTENSKYTFSNLLPGEYVLTITDTLNYCWENITHSVQITDVHSEAPEFRCSGVLFSISSTHDTQLKYDKNTSNNSESTSGVLAIKKGLQDFCLIETGTYDFKIVGCHTFQVSSFSWSRGNAPVSLIAVSHALTGSVISNLISDDIYINIYHSRNMTLKIRIGSLKNYAINAGNEYVYTFEINAMPEEMLLFVPESETFLFTPVSYEVRTSNDCSKLDVPFIAEVGVRFEGEVQPSLADVTVTVIRNDDDQNVVSAVTKNDGKFKFNPLPSNKEYSLIAQKEGYVLTGPSKSGIFIAKKLGEIIVQVEDENNTTLSNVLISLSGDQSYRQNSQTNENGEISFKSLQPGQYYARPILKEYKFVPPHKIVTIFEGMTLEIPFRAYRVLHSVYGHVLSLNGLPERGVVVEAIGKTDGLCVQLQEEATSEENGSFRIRGLQPRCGYNIRVKLSDELNLKIQKIIPETVYIQMNSTDVHGLNLRLVPRLAFTDVSILISVLNPIYLRTLTVKMFRGRGDSDLVSKVILNDRWNSNNKQNYRDNNHNSNNNKNDNDDHYYNYDYPLSSVIITMPVVPTNGENYYIRLDSSLSKNTYAYTSNVVHFIADTSFHLLRLSFKPQLKPPTTENETKNSYSAAVLIILSVIAYCYREAVINVLQGLPYVSITTPEVLNRITRRFVPKEEEVVVTKNFMEFEEPSLTVVKRKIRVRRT